MCFCFSLNSNKLILQKSIIKIIKINWTKNAYENEDKMQYLSMYFEIA
jgi:hypothetical protein